MKWKFLAQCAIAAMLFTPKLWEPPVFAQQPATAPSADENVLRGLFNVTGTPAANGRVFYAMPSGKMEKGTFLGVTTSNVPAALREQMSLPKGFGLVVETIEKDSPAEKAGILRYDILQKINDQLLVNQPQLQVLVRSMKPNDNVTITLLRKGQPVTVNATLVEKDVPELSDNVLEVPPSFPRMMQWQGTGDPATIFSNLSVERIPTVISSDGEQTLELTSKDDSKHLVVKDKQNKVIFEGPVDTNEQKAALPAGVADKLQNLEGKLDKIIVKVNAKRKVEKDAQEQRGQTDQQNQPQQNQ